MVFWGAATFFLRKILPDNVSKSLPHEPGSGPRRGEGVARAVRAWRGRRGRGEGVARARRGRGEGGEGVARAWRGHGENLRK